MKKRKAGKTDMELSLLGFGGFHLIETSLKDAKILLNTYLDAGGNYIETAAGYGNGNSEIKIGKVVSHRRSEFYLASKCHEREYKQAVHSIEQSLKNLQTEYLDVLFVHCLQTVKEAHTVLGDNGAMQAIQEAKQAGKIRYIAVSGHGRPKGLLNITRRYDFDVCMTMFNYYDRFNYPAIEKELLPELLKKNVAVLGMKALADGYLYKNPEAGIRYSLNLPISSLVMGFNRLDHLRQNLKICENFSPMSHNEYEELYKTAPQLSNYVCRLCGKCKTKAFDPQEYFIIEGVFDRQMERYRVEEPADFALRERLKHWFGQADEAKAEYAEMKQIQPDKDYSALNALCPYNIDIDQKLKIVHSKLSESVF